MNYLIRFFFVKLLPLTVLTILLSLTSIAWSGNVPREGSLTEYDTMPDTALLNAMKNIAQKQFVFGHHSVGNNILDGIKSLNSKSEIIQVNIIELNDQAPASKSGIYHFFPGKNRDPIGKIDEFVTIVSSSIEKGLHPDAVFLKFCFVDFDPKSDVNKIFSHYQSAISGLKQNHPDLRVLHLTVPLTTRSTGMKAKLKRLLRLEVWNDACNLARNRYNVLLHQNYPAIDIFDLAKNESTETDGTSLRAEYKGEAYDYLAQEYTNDGGHLNLLGRRRVASEFVFFLARH